MQNTTLVIGILGAIIVLLPRPAYALGAYFSILVWYPDYLRVSIGTIDISAGRIVIAVLLLRCVMNAQLRRKFVWSGLDKWVTASMAVYTVMYIATHPFAEAVENRGGYLMDAWFVYLAARMCIPDRAALATVIKIIAIILVPLALLGVIEAVTHWYSYRNLHQYCPWRSDVPLAQIRWGFSRAHGPFSHSIMFGACFVMFLPLIWWLRYQRDIWGRLAYLLAAMAIIGTFSCMSSSPWGMLTVVVLSLALGKYSYRLKGILMLLVVLCVLAEIGSNRRFYHVVLNYCNFGKGDWYQRARLIDVAIERFDEWWLVGYGAAGPGWAEDLNAKGTDMNNEFLLKGVQNGMLGVIALVGTFVLAFQGLVRAFKETTDKELRSLYWAMGCALTGIIVIWQGVSFFGQSVALFYILLGMIGSSFGLAGYAVVGAKRTQMVSNGNLISMYGQG